MWRFFACYISLTVTWHHPVPIGSVNTQTWDKNTRYFAVMPNFSQKTSYTLLVFVSVVSKSGNARYSPKLKYRHFHEIFVTWFTESCHWNEDVIWTKFPSLVPRKSFSRKYQIDENIFIGQLKMVAILRPRLVVDVCHDQVLITCLFLGPFTNMDLLQSLHGSLITSFIKCGMKWLIPNLQRCSRWSLGMDK